jgi:hypothetical protein
VRLLRFAASSSIARHPSLPQNAVLRVLPYSIRWRARIGADLWDGKDRGRAHATDRRLVFADNTTLPQIAGLEDRVTSAVVRFPFPISHIVDDKSSLLCAPTSSW